MSDPQHPPYFTAGPDASAEMCDMIKMLDLIRECDAMNPPQYEKRYGLVLMAVIQARLVGWPAGLHYDWQSGPDMNGFRIVAYIETPAGQLSWHLPEHPQEWDGHTTEAKYERVSTLVRTHGEGHLMDVIATAARKITPWANHVHVSVEPDGRYERSLDTRD